MLRHTFALFVLAGFGAGCSKPSVHEPAAATMPPSAASARAPAASANTSSRTADVVIAIDSAKAQTKEATVRVGQSFEVALGGPPDVTWTLAGNDRSLGQGTRVTRVGATVFRWKPMSRLQTGAHKLVFQGSKKETITVVVHVN